MPFLEEKHFIVKFLEKGFWYLLLLLWPINWGRCGTLSLPHLYFLLSYIIMNLQIFIKEMSLSQFQLFFLMLKLNLFASLTSRSPFMLDAISFDMPSKSDNLLSFWHKRYPRFIKYLLFLKSAASPYLWKSQLYNFWH